MADTVKVEATRVNPSTKPKAGGEPAPAAGKKKRHRSPSYPAINLEAALQRAKQMFANERKNAAPLDVVMQHWKFSPKSSGGLLAAAAMKKFGLLDEVPGTKDRHVRLSQRALNIILDEQEESPERDALVKEAALLPELHVELWKNHGPELPSPASLRTYLIRDKDFTETAANQFIEEYKQTISFAGLGSEDTIQNQEKEQDSGVKMETTTTETTQSQQLKPIPPVTINRSMQKPILAPGSVQDTFTLDEGAVALVYPANLSEHSLEDFKDWIQLAVRKIERSIKRKGEPATDGEN